MALHINNPQVDQLVAQAVSYTGQSKTRVVLDALKTYTDKIDPDEEREMRLKEINSLLASLPKLPSMTKQEEEDILGYNDMFDY